MRFALLAVVIVAAGCSAPAPGATLDATDGAKFHDAVLVRANVTNEADEALGVHFSQFSLRAGSGFFKCANQAWSWKLVDVDPTRRVVDTLTLAPGESVTAYLQFGLCSDVAGPYTLTWRGRTDGVLVRPINADPNTTIELDAMTLFARDWAEHERLVR